MSESHAQVLAGLQEGIKAIEAQSNVQKTKTVRTDLERIMADISRLVEELNKQEKTNEAAKADNEAVPKVIAEIDNASTDSCTQ